MRARCFLWLAAQWLPCSIPILLNFSRLNFSWLNFSWLNFSLPNFSLLNFSWLIFSLLNFSWLNFSWWILCTWILQDLQRRRTISSQSAHAAFCAESVQALQCWSWAFLVSDWGSLGLPGTKHNLFFPAKQDTYRLICACWIMNNNEYSWTCVFIFLRAIRVYQAQNILCFCLPSKTCIGKVILVELWIFLNHLRSTGFAARIM
jgi:hypothetical protein